MGLVGGGGALVLLCCIIVCIAVRYKRRDSFKRDVARTDEANATLQRLNAQAQDTQMTPRGRHSLQQMTPQQQQMQLQIQTEAQAQSRSWRARSHQQQQARSQQQRRDREALGIGGWDYLTPGSSQSRNVDEVDLRMHGQGRPPPPPMMIGSAKRSSSNLMKRKGSFNVQVDPMAQRDAGCSSSIDAERGAAPATAGGRRRGKTRASKYEGVQQGALYSTQI